jgi:lia operon protein LiaG
MLQRLLSGAIGSALLIPTLAGAQTQRVSLDGRDVAIYNLVGTMTVEGGSGGSVVVEVTRAGADAARLTVATNEVRGRPSLRVLYPDDHIVYPQLGYRDRSSFSVNDDGTFGDDHRDGWRGRHRQIEVRSSGSGLEAHADLHVIVPKGKSVFVRSGVGETTIQNVDGTLDVSVAASHLRASHVRGRLVLETGSGGVEVSDFTGDLTLDSGSGGATLDGVRGGAAHLDIGSGSLHGSSLDVTELVADVGSGGVRLAGVKTPTLRLDTGSGSTDVELLSAIDVIEVDAGSGGVTLRLPASTGARVDVETGSGGIDTDFEVKVARLERRALHGTIGDGHGRIHIQAGSGSVRLLKH